MGAAIGSVGDLWREAIRSLGGGMEVASGNIFFRPNFLKKAGDKVDGHKHNFDHTTFFLPGGRFRVIARLNGVVIADEEITGPAIRLILKDVEHEIIALVDDSVFFCVYSNRDPQGNVIERCEGYMPAYS